MKRTPLPPALPGLGPGRLPPAPGAFNPVAPNPAALLQGAVRAHEAGRAAEAERGYRLVMQITPNDPAVPAHLGALVLEQGRWSEGVALLDRCLAIDPRQPHVLTNRGAALIELGRVPEAIASYEAAIALQPAGQQADGFNNLGAYLHGLGCAAEAMDAYDQAVALNPRLAEAWGNRGISLTALGRLDEALASLDRAIALNPAYADAWTGRGIALYGSARSAEALPAFDRALALKPDAAEIHNNKGLALQALDRLDEALASADRAVGLQPDLAENHNNRGMALQAMGRAQDAIAAFDRAIALRSDYPEPYWNKSLVLIQQRDYEAGWRLFEWRWKRADAPPEPQFNRPLWLGQEPLAGKTLLLHAEQGLGDSIQMLRYVPMLAAQGAKVVLAAPKALIELARSLEGIDTVIAQDAQAGAPVAFDFHCPLMSLPCALGTRIDTIPAAIPYLSAPQAKIDEWRARLGPKTRRRIGLTWSGNREQKNDRHRSIPLRAWLPLLDADADFISLQREYREADAAVLRAEGRIRDYAAFLNDFTDTAALAEEMDLVISVCTSVAHLSGALGRPTFILLTRHPHYVWHTEQTDSPWYPTGRLFRQSVAGDWDGVIAKVLAAL